MSQTFTAHVAHAVMAADMVIVNGREIPSSGVTIDDRGVTFQLEGRLLAFVPNQNVEIDQKGFTRVRWCDASGATNDAPCELHFRMIVPFTADHLVTSVRENVPISAVILMDQERSQLERQRA